MAGAASGPAADADGDADDPGEADTGVEEAVPDVPDSEADAGCTVDGDCDDSDPCTTDVCDEIADACDHQPDDAVCDDANGRLLWVVENAPNYLLIGPCSAEEVKVVLEVVEE